MPKRTGRSRKKSSRKSGRDVKKTKKRKASSSPARQRKKEGEGARVQSALKLFFFQRKSLISHRARVVFFCVFSKRMLRALLTSDTVWRWTRVSALSSASSRARSIFTNARQRRLFYKGECCARLPKTEPTGKRKVVGRGDTFP